VVIEIPFAPPGRPNRFVGRQEFLAYANPQRAAMPIRIDSYETLAVHETADPDTIVVEYELTGTHLLTNKQATAGFIGVLTVADGKIKRWREYQNTLAMMQALG
jgi:ketosteroid isomerase-like protein